MKKNSIGTGLLYFYIHFITEIVCFYILSSKLGRGALLWTIPLYYDCLAFVPQSLIGYFSDCHPKINLSIIGTILLFLSVILFRIKINAYFLVIVLCLGNALMHVNGAKVTLRCSKDYLSPAAIFVSGGSFGVITGRVLSNYGIPYYYILFLILTMIPFILLAEYYYAESDVNDLKKFNYLNKSINKSLIIILAVIVVIVSGYMGYGIPTSWNKTLMQSILLYVFMGTGKALGGILSDIFGMKKKLLLVPLWPFHFYSLAII